MARNNRMSATFIMDSGDGAGGFTEQYGTTRSFTSGDCVKDRRYCWWKHYRLILSLITEWLKPMVFILKIEVPYKRTYHIYE